VPEAQSETEPRCAHRWPLPGRAGHHHRGRVICRHLPSYLPPGAGWSHRKHGKASSSRRLPPMVPRRVGHPRDRQGRYRSASGRDPDRAPRCAAGI